MGTFPNVVYFLLLKECPNKCQANFEQLETTLQTKEVLKKKSVNRVLHVGSLNMDKQALCAFVVCELWLDDGVLGENFVDLQFMRHLSRNF